MYKLYTTSENQIIAYKYYKSKKKTDITTIFLHGLMSDMESSKAIYFYNYCVAKDISFLAFDNFGQGKSSGEFTEQTARSWLQGIDIVLNHIVAGDVVLIGSSAGAWTALLGAMSYERVKGLICIAPAPDFTEMIRDSLSQEELKTLQQDGLIEINNDGNYPPTPISYKLIEESKKHLLLGLDKIDISCPVHLIHGLQDKIVPHEVSLKLFEKITSGQTVLKLIKDGNHSLSAPPYMQIICNSLEEVLDSGQARGGL